MHRLSAKLGLFGAVWYELVVELGLGPELAFFVTLSLTVFSTVTLRMMGMAIHIAGPGMVSVTAHGLVWFILLWWIVPFPLWQVPLLYDVGVALALGLAGVKARQVLASRRVQLALAQPRIRFPIIIFSVMAGVATGMLALHRWASLLPLIGWALVVLIPFRIGWQLAPPVTPERADARMGDKQTFEDAGWSAER